MLRMTALTALVRAAAPFVVSLGILGGCDDKEPPPPTQEEVMRRFHELWYLDAGTWMKNSFFGIHTEQNPMDVWVTQEILHEVKPDFMIECGSMHGGSAALWATLLEQFNPEAKVISIDITDRMQEARKLPIVQRRVEFIVSSSTDKALVEKLAKRVKGKKVLVLLDSDHSKPHVLQELRSYSPMVSVGSYILVQGSNVNGHPVSPNSHPQGGPWEAIEEFMRGSDAFQIDTSRERLLFTLSPSGFLKRVK